LAARGRTSGCAARRAPSLIIASPCATGRQPNSALPDGPGRQQTQVRQVPWPLKQPAAAQTLSMVTSRTTLPLPLHPLYICFTRWVDVYPATYSAAILFITYTQGTATQHGRTFLHVRGPARPHPVTSPFLSEASLRSGRSASATTLQQSYGSRILRSGTGISKRYRAHTCRDLPQLLSASACTAANGSKLKAMMPANSGVTESAAEGCTWPLCRLLQ